MEIIKFPAKSTSTCTDPVRMCPFHLDSKMLPEVLSDLTLSSFILIWSA
jgi:hypothetical protein